MAVALQLDATRSKRGLIPADEPRRVEPDEVTRQFWRRLIFSAVHDAKRTRCGLPTDSAILARWWISEHKPERTQKDEWERSFECACERVDRDVIELRMKLLADIDKSLRQAYELHVQSVIYVRRGMVLACSGIPTAIARQYLLPLVDKQDYEHVADVDYGDQYALYDQRDEPAA